MASRSLLTWRVENAVSKDEADVYIFDVIGDPWDGVSSADFSQEMRGIKAKRINLHINSPGGYVNDALAMFTAIQSHPAETHAYVVGSADSAASFLIQAADQRHIAAHSSMTIHDGMALAMGTAADMRSIADRLEEDSANIASIYQARAGGTIDEWRQRMQAGERNSGTTYRGQAAVDIGLCDDVAIPSRNAIPAKIAALFGGNADSDSTPSVPATGLGEALRAARLESAAPTLQQLLEQSGSSITAAFGKGA